MTQDQGIGHIRWSRHFLEERADFECDSGLFDELPLDMDWIKART